MDVVIVYKPDGTLQCLDIAPVPLEEHAEQLTGIGASKICGQANVFGPNFVITLCGAPTGQVNAFAIPKADWDGIISRGIVGPVGFKLWMGAPLPPIEMDPECHITKEIPATPPGGPVGSTPVLIRELLGRPVRCYKQGDALTMDFVPERVNIEHDEGGRISDVWFG